MTFHGRSAQGSYEGLLGIVESDQGDLTVSFAPRQFGKRSHGSAKTKGLSLLGYFFVAAIASVLCDVGIEIGVSFQRTLACILGNETQSIVVGSRKDSDLARQFRNRFRINIRGALPHGKEDCSCRAGFLMAIHRQPFLWVLLREAIRRNWTGNREFEGALSGRRKGTVAGPPAAGAAL